MDAPPQAWSGVDVPEDCSKFAEFYQIYQQGLGDLAEESFSLIRCETSFEVGSAVLSPEFPSVQPHVLHRNSAFSEDVQFIDDGTHADFAELTSGPVEPISMESSPTLLERMLVNPSCDIPVPTCVKRSSSLIRQISVPSTPGPTDYMDSVRTSHLLPVAKQTISPRRGRPKKGCSVIAGPKKAKSSSQKKRSPVARQIAPREKENLPVVDFVLDDSFEPDKFNYDFADDEHSEFSPTPTKDEDNADLGKPSYSYSALVTLALKNSRSGRMTVRDIYNFMCHHFPYFANAPTGWKNSVRHNLSLNPAFLKIVGDSGPAKARTACRWTVNPLKFAKMDDDIRRHGAKGREGIRRSMRFPEILEELERGTFSDFHRAVQGVTVQYKQPRDDRKKESRKKSSLKKLKAAQLDSKCGEDSGSYYSSQSFDPVASEYLYDLEPSPESVPPSLPSSPFEAMDQHNPYLWTNTQYSPLYPSYNYYE